MVGLSLSHGIIFGHAPMLFIHVQLKACRIFSIQYCNFLFAGLKCTPFFFGSVYAWCYCRCISSSFCVRILYHPDSFSKFHFFLFLMPSPLSQFSVIFFFVLIISCSSALFCLYISDTSYALLLLLLLLPLSPLSTHTTVTCSLVCLHFK